MTKFLSIAALLLILSPIAKADDTSTASQAPSFHRLQLNANVGVQDSTNNANSGMLPEYGAKIGLDFGTIGDFAHLMPTLAYSYSTMDMGFFFGSYDATTYEIQFNFRHAFDTGLYFGPKFGTMNLGATLFGETITKTYFSYGIVAGYEFFKDHIVSISPEFQLTHFSEATTYSMILGLNLNLF